MLGLFKEDPSKLLKKATSAKKSGNFEEAISLLRKAYKAISKNKLDYGVKPFLRLPLLLQEAGRPEEAWDEFHRLLTKGYPNQSKDPQLVPMNHSEIYDKIRLFLQKEERNDEAIKYGIFSHLSWASGLYLQKRRDEFKDFIGEDFSMDGMDLISEFSSLDFSDPMKSLSKLQSLSSLEQEDAESEYNKIFGEAEETEENDMNFMSSLFGEDFGMGSFFF